LTGVLKARYSLVKQNDGFGNGLQRISLRSDTDEIRLERSGEDCMTLCLGTRERKYKYSELSLYTLMNEELSILGPDSIFESAFERALEIETV
jgi:hypothetical protein